MMPDSDVSGKLGELMLKGWILTDSVCSTAGCNVPLMRSPKGRSPVVDFCAKCDGDRQNPSKPPSIQTSSASPTHSSASTPPTDVSSSSSSPTFMIPPESEAAIRRRQQSDRASSEIGKLLLKGWAMLAEECPNPDCFGVPLVRPPNSARASKDQKMECVACRAVYVFQRNALGQESLVPFADAFVNPEPVATLSSVPPIQPQSHPLAARTAPPVPPSNSIAPPRTGVDAAAQSLDLVLYTLSQQLNTAIQRGPPLDLAALMLIADTISKTSQSLSVLQQVQQSRR